MELHRDVMWITVTWRHKSRLTSTDFFSKFTLYYWCYFFEKNSPKMFKKLPKSGSSKHPWLTANAQLGTSFFGNLKNPAIFKFQNVGRPEHLWSPLVSKHKNHVFSEGRRRRRTSSLDRAHGRKGRFAQLYTLDYYRKLFCKNIRIASC